MYIRNIVNNFFSFSDELWCPKINLGTAVHRLKTAAIYYIILVGLFHVNSSYSPKLLNKT